MLHVTFKVAYALAHSIYSLIQFYFFINILFLVSLISCGLDSVLYDSMSFENQLAWIFFCISCLAILSFFGGGAGNHFFFLVRQCELPIFHSYILGSW